MTTEAADWGFVGQAYTAPDPYQDSQACINWYPEFSDDDKSKMPTALLGTPGKVQLFDFSTTTDGIAIPPSGGVRAIWVLPGGRDCLWVVGKALILTRMVVPATQTTIAQFSRFFIGNLLTNSGPVCIRDNGFSSGTTVACLVDGPNGYYYNMTTTTLTQITDPGFLGADRVCFTRGFFAFNKPGTQTWYTTGPTPYATTFPASFFNLKDIYSDNLVTMDELNGEIWLIGEKDYEVWAYSGGANFAFSRIPGVAGQVGCAAKHSIAQVGERLVWLGRNDRGENIVIGSQQYGYERISSHGVEAAIASYPQVGDAEGWSYQEEGHVFYVLTFPTADKTWVYDETASRRAGTPQWHQRASFDPNTGVSHRDKAAWGANYQNLRVTGDAQNQLGYYMSRKTYVDGATPLLATRRTPFIWDPQTRKRVQMMKLEVDFAKAVGTIIGQGVDPRLMLRISRDYGATYGTQYFVRLGKTGETKNRAIRRRLAATRAGVVEVTYSDPTNRDIVGATLTAQQEESSGNSTV